VTPLEFLYKFFWILKLVCWKLTAKVSQLKHNLCSRHVIKPTNADCDRRTDRRLEDS